MSVRISSLLSAASDVKRLCLFNASPDTDLSAYAGFDLHVVSAMKPVIDFFQDRGISAGTAPEGRFDLAVVMLPRAKKLGLAQIEAASHIAPSVIVDGQKTDGIESVLKALKKKLSLGATVSKAHGKAAIFASEASALADWADPGALTLVEGFQTRLGVFSSDRIDVASKLLAEALPASLPKHIADFGAGWGYLSRAILARDGVQSLDLVEADYAAVLCARENITDERAKVHWADATVFKPAQRYDAVIMNPPFHTGRAAEPALGQAFIRNAARHLKPNGDLWLVANRQLPYEAVLNASFKSCTEIGGTGMFKLLRASKPLSSPRGDA